jgi:hemerythrin
MHVTAAGLMNHGKPALLPDEKAALGDRFATRQAGAILPARRDRRYTAAKAMHPVESAMALIEWTEDLNTGIQVIDNQHQRIVEYINTLDDVSRIPDREVVGKVVGDLIDYTYSHFAFEEALMEEAGYEYLSIHQNTHNSFCERIDQFRKRFDDGEDIAESLAELLRTWLINHIMSDDESYAALVKEKMPRIESKHQGTWLGSAVKRFFTY